MMCVCVHAHVMCESLTCCSHGGIRGLHDVSMDGFGAWLLLETSRSRFDDVIHVLHQLELLPPQILFLDVVPPRLIVIPLLLLLLCFQPGGRYENAEDKGIILLLLLKPAPYFIFISVHTKEDRHIWG